MENFPGHQVYLNSIILCFNFSFLESFPGIQPNISFEDAIQAGKTTVLTGSFVRKPCCSQRYILVKMRPALLVKRLSTMDLF